MALKIIIVIYLLFLFVITVYSLVQAKKGRDPDKISLFLLASFLMEIFLLCDLYFKFATFINDIFYVLFDLFIIIYFAKFYNKSVKALNNWFFGLAVLSIFTTVCILFFNRFNYSDYNTINVCIYLIFSGITYFYYVIEHDKSGRKITHIPQFWITAANILWGCSTIFRFIPRFYLQKIDPEFMESIRIIFIMFLIVNYSFFLKAVQLYKKAS